MESSSPKKGNKFQQLVIRLKPVQSFFDRVFRLCLILIIVLISTHVAKANIGISAEGKSWFTFEVKAGTNISTKAILTNKSNELIKVNVYPVEAVENKKNESFLPGNYDPSSSFSKWISKSTPITLEAMSTKEFPFTISIPENTPSGEYVGAMMAEEKGNDEMISMNTRVGARIYITILGKNTSEPKETEHKLDTKIQETIVKQQNADTIEQKVSPKSETIPPVQAIKSLDATPGFTFIPAEEMQLQEVASMAPINIALIGIVIAFLISLIIKWIIK